MAPPRFSNLRQIPKGIWALGFVSLLMDISSEMIHALLPIYLVSVLGASMLTVGLIEGMAEATASITKIFSGALSDYLGKRKLLALIGYALAALAKPIFPLANTIPLLIGARFLDRVGKGIRGAPRDALLSEIAPKHLRGASFGLRQSLDTIGAFLGPGLAIALMALSGDNFRAVFWVAVLPAFLCVALLFLGVEEPERPKSARKMRFPLSLAEMSRLGPAFWFLVGLALVFTLARFSEAFLILRAQAVGLPIALAPAVLVAMNIAYALTAYPSGALSDRMNRVSVLALGFGLLVLADLVLALTGTILGAGIGVILWGLHMGFTQGLLSALVADSSPEELRGTAFGVFNLLCGLAQLLASVIAGLLWDALGAEATFLAGAGFTALALFGLFLLRRLLPGIGESARH